ncbi:hypothetical protein H2204_000833 [Knufia peltigerae]|uniref:Mitochondrial carrier protein n=1 Tax=Knufia peltigerae TaxID=1002370 RepID=A0AA39D204_9EURO|nr:hypothetical protein H2204_000833 [Knufia peltigerae]
MFAENAMALSVAAGGAAALTDGIIHPLDTVICRIQSGNAPHGTTSTTSRLFDKTLFHRLYRGFGPTVVANIPASIAFFTVYDSVRASFSKARAAGHFASLPRSFDYAAGSAAGELLACAIINPAQVLKQNAQAIRTPSHRHPPDQLSRSAAAQVLKLLRLFVKQPSKLWAGYSVLVAAQLPHVCLMFSIYEELKQNSPFEYCRPQTGDSDPVQQVKASAVCGAIAGCCSSWIFVPADVIRLRMRLAAGRAVEDQHSRTITTVEGVGVKSAKPKLANLNALAFARDIVRREGWAALFRGSLLTCIAAGVGGGIYLGSYEAIKTLCNMEE